MGSITLPLPYVILMAPRAGPAPAPAGIRLEDVPLNGVPRGAGAPLLELHGVSLRTPGGARTLVDALDLRVRCPGPSPACARLAVGCARDWPEGAVVHARWLLCTPGGRCAHGSK